MKEKSLLFRWKKSVFYSISIVLILCLSFLPKELKAQTENEDVDWSFIQETSGVKFYYKKGTCNAQKVIFLKIINNSDVKVAGSWKISVDATPRNLILTDVLMPIDAGSEVMGGCNSSVPHLTVPIDWSAYEFLGLTLVAELY